MSLRIVGLIYVFFFHFIFFYLYDFIIAISFLGKTVPLKRCFCYVWFKYRVILLETWVPRKFSRFYPMGFGKFFQCLQYLGIFSFADHLAFCDAYAVIWRRMAEEKIAIAKDVTEVSSQHCNIAFCCRVLIWNLSYGLRSLLLLTWIADW